MNPTAIVPVGTSGRKTFAFGFSRRSPAGVAAVALWNQALGNGGGGDAITASSSPSPHRLEVKINKRTASSRPSAYTDIKSEVESVTQIITLVPEGTTVEKGRMCWITLDSSPCVRKKEQLDLDLRKAESNRKISSDMKDIQESQIRPTRKWLRWPSSLASSISSEYIEGSIHSPWENAQDRANRCPN